MLFVEGVGFNGKAEYEQGLSDKKIIDELRKKYDLTTKEGLLDVSKELRTIHFQTKVGDNFDDEIFEKFEAIKRGETLNPQTPAPASRRPSRTSKSKTPSKTSSLSVKEHPMDKKMEEAVRRELKKKNLIRNILISILLLVAVGSIGYYVKYYSDAKKVQEQSDEFSELKDAKFAEVLKNVEPVVKKEYDETVVIPDILDEYKALFNKNKSLIGWIEIADTIIDYPVMQTKDNEYYLKHDFNQKNDANGCIFLDCNCDVILGNDNWILYGHHMKNGKMFSSLIKYADMDYYEKHKYIRFDTIYEKGTYEVMYAFRSRIYNTNEITFKYYQFVDANSSEEFDSYMEEMEKMSLIDTGVSATYGDKLLTLSTCDYQEENGRFVVVAKRID
ncbi:MAG: class B sortase [Lachnospiraceae bacterium]|nr:class B sortase [Lachnospiraceae bacterium]